MYLEDYPTDVIMMGTMAAILRYNYSLGQWIIESQYHDLTIVTNASQSSFALGKHNWTISGDNIECFKNQESYTIEMKLTACKEGQFTCDDGQCVVRFPNPLRTFMAVGEPD